MPECIVTEGFSVWSRYYSLNTGFPIFANRTPTGSPSEIYTVDSFLNNGDDFCRLWTIYAKAAPERAETCQWILDSKLSRFTKIFKRQELLKKQATTVENSKATGA